MNTELKLMVQFSLPKEIEKEVEEKSYNDQDGEITIKKKVKGTEDVWFALQEPTRFIAEEGECYYASQFSKFVQAGLLTRAMLQKRILDDKGLLSQKDNEKFSNLYVQLTQLQVDLYGLRLKDEKDLSSEEQEKMSHLELEINRVSREIQAFESIYSSVYDNTAEAKATNRLLRWWLVYLSCIKNNDKYESLFGNGTFENKMEKFDEIVQSKDIFYAKVFEKLSFYIGVWHNQYASTQEEFDKFEERARKYSTMTNTSTPTSEEKSSS